MPLEGLNQEISKIEGLPSDSKVAAPTKAEKQEKKVANVTSEILSEASRLADMSMNECSINSLERKQSSFERGKEKIRELQNEFEKIKTTGSPQEIADGEARIDYANRVLQIKGKTIRNDLNVAHTLAYEQKIAEDCRIRHELLREGLPPLAKLVLDMKYLHERLVMNAENRFTKSNFLENAEREFNKLLGKFKAALKNDRNTDETKKLMQETFYQDANSVQNLLKPPQVAPIA